MDRDELVKRVHYLNGSHGSLTDHQLVKLCRWLYLKNPDLWDYAYLNVNEVAPYKFVLVESPWCERPFTQNLFADISYGWSETFFSRIEWTDGDDNWKPWADAAYKE